MSDYEEIKDVLLGAPDCEYCEYCEYCEKREEKPADRARRDFHGDTEAKILIHWDIGLRSESLKLWQVLLLIQEEGFEISDFENDDPGGWRRWNGSDIGYVGEFVHAAWRFRWEKE